MNYPKVLNLCLILGLTASFLLSPRVFAKDSLLQLTGMVRSKSQKPQPVPVRDHLTKVLPKPLQERWSQTSFYLRTRAGDKAVQNQHTRYLVFPKFNVPIGYLNSIRIDYSAKTKIPSSKERREALAKMIKTFYKTAKVDWVKSSYGDIQVLETYLAPSHRILRVFIEEKPTYTSYSLASYRPAYAYPLAIEMEILQRTLHGVPIENRNSAFLDSALDKFQKFVDILLPRASAIARFPGYGSFSGQSLSATANAYSSDLPSGIQSNLNRAFNLGDGFLERVDKGIFEVKDLSQSVREFNQTGQDLTSSIERAGDNIEEIADIAKEQTEPGNLLRTGFFAGLGTSVGFMAANLVVDLATQVGGWALQELYLGITGNIKDEELSRLRAQAGASIDQLKEAGNALGLAQLNLDKMILAMQIAHQVGPDALAGMVDKKIREVSRALDLEKGRAERRKQALYDAEDRGKPTGELEQSYNVCQDKIDYLEVQLRELMMLQSVFAEVGPGERSASGGMAAALCRRIQGQFNQWADAEYSLRMAQGSLLASYLYKMTGDEQAASGAFNVSYSARRGVKQCVNTQDQMRETISEIDKSDLVLLRASAESGIEAYGANCERVVEETFNPKLMAKLYADSVELTAYRSARVAEDVTQMIGDFCKEGERGGPCSGESGRFEKIAKYYNNQLERARGVCPGLPTPSRSIGGPPPGAAPASGPAPEVREASDDPPGTLLGRTVMSWIVNPIMSIFS